VVDDLFERGFAVVPGFFTADELAVVRDDFTALARAGEEQKGQELVSQLHFDDRQMRPLRARISSLVESVTARSPGDRGLLPMAIGNYIRSREVKYGFHCDYGLLGPSRGAFKLWIPLVKPDRERDGMTFVRMDRFREREPYIARRIAGRGAAGIRDTGEVVVIGRSVEVFRLSQPIDDLCETPEVGVGDLVVFRAQDTFHRSQLDSPGADPGRPERIAWAFPVRIAGDAIEWNQAFESRKKREFVGKRRAAEVLACFLYHRRKRITAEELDRFERQLHARRLVPRALLAAALAAEPLVWPGEPE
jgi:hypothetical protein